MIDNVSSVDNLDFIMESDALSHKVMDQRQGHESLLGVAGTVTLDEVCSLLVVEKCAFLYTYFAVADSYFIKPTYRCKSLLEA
jgi:hypothetical protein